MNREGSDGAWALHKIVAGLAGSSRAQGAHIGSLLYISASRQRGRGASAQRQVTFSSSTPSSATAGRVPALWQQATTSNSLLNIHATPLPPLAPLAPPPHCPPHRHRDAPSMASWKAACACGRLSLKVGVIMVFSTLKGSGCRCTEATCSRKEGGMGQWEEQHARLSRGLIHCLFGTSWPHTLADRIATRQ